MNPAIVMLLLLSGRQVSCRARLAPLTCDTRSEPRLLWGGSYTDTGVRWIDEAHFHMAADGNMLYNGICFAGVCKLS